jgi:sortase (surface protein transpeptidase)
VYEVREVRGYVSPNDKKALGEKTYPWLTLITCRGYDEDSDTYRWRVVVQAVQVEIR